MFKFSMEAPIVDETRQDIINGLEEILHLLRRDKFAGLLPGEHQGAMWMLEEVETPDE